MFVSYKLLLVLVIMAEASNEVIEKCCRQGEAIFSNKSRNGTFEAGDCSEFPVPIANVSQEHQNVCLATMEICCLSAHRENACEKGYEMAQAGLPCQIDQQWCAAEAEETLIECCLACNIGSMADDCTQITMPSKYSQTTFVRCCSGHDNDPNVDRCPRGFTFNEALQVMNDDLHHSIVQLYFVRCVMMSTSAF